MSNQPSNPTPPAVRAGETLQTLLLQGAQSAGRREDRRTCLAYAKVHLEAANHSLGGPHPHTCIFNLEYAIMQIGNAIALGFHRTIENKPDSGHTHTLAAAIVEAYCQQRHPELLPGAALASVSVRNRNNYMYRHQAVSDQEAKRFGRAVGELYKGLFAEIEAARGWVPVAPR